MSPADKTVFTHRIQCFQSERLHLLSLTGGSLSDTGWGWLWCREWSPLHPACTRSRRTSGSPHASTYPEPSAGSDPWSSGCSRHSLLAWCPAGRWAFVYLKTHTCSLISWPFISQSPQAKVGGTLKQNSWWEINGDDKLNVCNLYYTLPLHNYCI